jgi:hypothetical protein
MKLMRLNPVEVRAPSAALIIRCCKCGDARKYGEAVAAGWCADLAGKPFADYVCANCQKVRIRVRPGSYGWARADKIPGFGPMEMGPLETEAVPLGNGKYAVVLPDGKEVYVRGDEIPGKD